jgi:hypothetical protein
MKNGAKESSNAGLRERVAVVVTGEAVSTGRVQ